MSSSTPRLSRRLLFAGAGSAGALAAAVNLLPTLAPVAAKPAALGAAKPARGGGYALSAHVQHYYQTTRV